MTGGVPELSSRTRVDPFDQVGRLRLPLRLADFSRRGFRLDRPAKRATLENHARHFLGGFNLAVRHWRDPHPVLSAVTPYERGFAYEGAAMQAALRDVLTAGRAGALSRLLGGMGDRYVHLIHVGYGWAFVPLSVSLRVPLPVPRPATPLLRWLALDGAGFAEAYFGGLRSLYRRCRGRSGAAWQARVSGCGRALWFLESADVDGVTRAVELAAPPSRPWLWSGIGLAACYAGSADESEVDDLVAASGRHWPHFGQGVVFAVAARSLSGIVPPHSERMCRHLFGVAPDEAKAWTDEAAKGLTGSVNVSAYSEWRSRLRARVARQK